MIKKYNNMYPRCFWISDVNTQDIEKTYKELTNKFTFLANAPGWRTVSDNFENEFFSAVNETYAGCYPVIEKKTGLIGVMCIMYNEKLKISEIAHESVHIADYFFEALGMNGEDFTEGDEAYAYLVGWIAGCFDNFLNE